MGAIPLSSSILWIKHRDLRNAFFGVVNTNKNVHTTKRKRCESFVEFSRKRKSPKEICKANLSIPCVGGRKLEIEMWKHFCFFFSQRKIWLDSNFFCQTYEFFEAHKGTRGMPWHSSAMKDAISCDKLRLGAHSHLTRRFPNGITQPHLCGYLELNT